MSADANKPEVLVIDHDLQIRRLLRITLEVAGYAVREASCALTGQGEVLHRTPSAIILELEMANGAGLEMLKRLREWNAVPVMILSASGKESCKVAALDAGADDFLTKPFGCGELLARLRALLRRIKPAVATNTFVFGSVEVDLARRRIVKAGRVLKLTSMEYALLQLFITHRDKVLTHRQVLRELWGPKAEAQTHYLRTYMLRLRRKLENDLTGPRHFQTESGIGYRFVTEPVETS